MTETLVRASVVGYLSMGRSHAEAPTAIDGVGLVGYADHTVETTRSFDETYGCPSYTDHVTLLADADLDAICVCTFSGAHRDIVADTAAGGIDMLCEKLLEITSDRVNNMVAARHGVGVTLAYILQWRLFSMI